MALKRRAFLKAMPVALALAGGARRASAQAKETAVPLRPITRGPRPHWFGYYDKLQFDPSGRYALGMEVGFEHRSPRAEDAIRVGMVDLGDGDRWIDLGESRAWGWQQGCMLQWVPGSKREVLWNDRQGERFVCHVLDVETKKRRTIPHAVYALSPDGRTAVAPDFSRIQAMRPGYGYAGLADPHADEMAPKDSGILRVDLASGTQELILSLADVVGLGSPHASMAGAKHYVNHLLFNTDGSRFIFLHRWRPDGGKGPFITRMLTAAPDGRDVRVVDPSGRTSHFIWRDPTHICAWTQPEGDPAGFYLFEDGTGRVEPVGAGVMTVNGHNTYLPGRDNAWILNDTYPQGKERLQTVYLYHVPTGRKVVLGRFHLPRAYQGEWRCDTHPRSSRDGRLVCIDSPHDGSGRQMWLMDVGAIVG